MRGRWVILLLLASTLLLQAKPARPGLVKQVQPDGSVLSLQLVGDEWGHYALDAQGRVFCQDADGFYRLSGMPGEYAARELMSARSRRIRRKIPAAQPVEGTRLRVPVILIEFDDVRFSLEEPASRFASLMTERGYAGSGSVHDYFMDNTGGQIDFQFDVLGPVLLEKPISAYGKDLIVNGIRVGDAAPEQALLDACTALEGSVEWAQYDQNGDGTVDLVIFIYAGYDQAEGAKSESFWSHTWDVQSSENEWKSTLFDERLLGPYLCTSELKGSSGTDMQGIGSTCHEIGHFLGLPDFYDTNGVTGGVAGGLYQYSLMSTGLYNNGSATPPYLNYVERAMLGFAGEELPLLPSGWVELSPVEENAAYYVPTGTEGECFIYECRSGSGWDAPLQAGLLVYHLDQSSRTVGSMTAAEHWLSWAQYNDINALAAHPLFYLLPSSSPQSLEYASLKPGQIVYPGVNEVLAQEGKDWEGAYTAWQITNISFTGSRVRAYVQQWNRPNINGIVRGMDGTPLEGVLLQSGDSTAYSGADGFYRLPLPAGCEGTVSRVSASKAGYRAQQREVSLNGGRVATALFALRQDGESDVSVLSKYSSSGRVGYYPQAGIGAMCLSPRDLAPFVGHQLREIVFYPCVKEGFSGKVYVTVDVGEQRVLTREVEELRAGQYAQHSLDISDTGLIIPEGLPLYIGYGSPEADEKFTIGTTYPATKGDSYFSLYSPNKSAWKDLYIDKAGYYMAVMISATAAENPGVEDLSLLGYSYIDPGKGAPWRAGDSLELRCHVPEGVRVTSVEWTLDGKGERAGTISLTAGKHIIKAALRYADGRSEELEMQLEVE